MGRNCACFRSCARAMYKLASNIASSSRTTTALPRYLSTSTRTPRTHLIGKYPSLSPSLSRYYTTSNVDGSAEGAIPEIAQEDSYDIVIIGGGNAGLALACALRELAFCALSQASGSFQSNSRQALHTRYDTDTTPRRWKFESSAKMG
jgi:hypothetical protein